MFDETTWRAAAERPKQQSIIFCVQLVSGRRAFRLSSRYSGV